MIAFSCETVVAEGEVDMVAVDVEITTGMAEVLGLIDISMAVIAPVPTNMGESLQITKLY